MADECHNYMLSFLAQLGTTTLVVQGDARIALCTECCAGLFGPVERLVGRRLADLGLELVDGDGCPETAECFPLDRLHGDGSVSRFLFGMLAPDRNRRWLSATLKPAGGADPLPGCSYLTLTDITGVYQDRLVNRQIFQAKSEWETTVDALQDVVTIQDPDLRVVRANKAAHALFGFSLGEMKGKKCYELFLGRTRPCRKCLLTRPDPEPGPEVRTVYHAGLGRMFQVSSFPIFAENGEIRLLVHVARDVTLFLQNESEKNRLTAAIEQASESVLICDSSGVIEYVNPAFERTTGYSRAEAIGRNVDILRSGVHEPQFYEELWQTLRRRQVWRGRLTSRRKNGALFTEDATISPVLDGSGRVVNYVSLSRDITREELLEKQLHQTFKMEALGTLAGGIAHDFKNILAAMIGYGEMAKNRLPADHPARRDIDQVLAGGDRAVDLVKQILTFSRQESLGRFRLFKLQHTVREAIKLLRPSLPPTVELIHHIDDSCRSILADPGQIYQVLMNLCTNAWQSIGEDHGRITIRLTERRLTAEEAARFGGKARESESFLDLEVTDSGCGIGEDALARIFDPFYTTKKSQQGTGLGLAVVHGIIKKHKGEIEVASHVGVGTTFHVYLPVDGREVEEEKPRNLPVSGGDERIMVIDDEAPVAEVLRRGLEAAGYRVMTFDNSIEAVKRFRQDPDCCDLVLTDMLMPGMTGTELAREFLARRPGLPIIMLTGYSENFDLRRAKTIGVRELLFKPVKRETLQEIVRRVLEHGKNSDN